MTQQKSGSFRKYAAEFLGWLLANVLVFFTLYLFNTMCVLNFNPYNFNPFLRTASAFFYCLFFLFSTWKFYHDNFNSNGG